MSLDVYLESEPETATCVCAACGHTHTNLDRAIYFSSNTTHNLGKMAGEAGIYEALWRPEEIGITKADQLIEPLTVGLNLLKSDPVRFKKFDSPNGRGLYIHFVPFVKEYLDACKEYPQALVRASR